MTRPLFAIIALLFSLTSTAIEAPVTHVAKNDALSQPAVSVETICTIAQHTEKHFLPVEELKLALVYADYKTVSLYAPAYPTTTADLNIRSPPLSMPKL